MQQIIVDFGVLELFGASIPLRIYGYGLMMVLGFLLGILLAAWRARRAGENPEYLVYCGVLALLGGVVGARLAYVIEHWSTFAGPGGSMADVLDVSSGGLIYYGGFILATVMVVGYFLLKRVPIRRYLDILAVSLMIGLAFGRAGCALNGCCGGDRCSEDWALGMRFPMCTRPLLKFGGGDHPFPSEGPVLTPAYMEQWNHGLIKPDSRLLDVEGRLINPRDLTPEQIAIAEQSWSLPLKPAQLLGLASALVLAGLLSLFYRLRTREGQVFALLLILYPITRFLLEMIRLNKPTTAGLTHNQLTSLAMLTAGVIMWLWLLRLPASAGPTWYERAAASAAARTGGRKRKR